MKWVKTFGTYIISWTVEKVNGCNFDRLDPDPLNLYPDPQLSF